MSNFLHPMYRNTNYSSEWTYLITKPLWLSWSINNHRTYKFHQCLQVIANALSLYCGNENSTRVESCPWVFSTNHTNRVIVFWMFQFLLQNAHGKYCFVVTDPHLQYRQAYSSESNDGNSIELTLRKITLHRWFTRNVNIMRLHILQLQWGSSTAFYAFFQNYCAFFSPQYLPFVQFRSK